jgi:methionyl-tRNA formyltransferase
MPSASTLPDSAPPPFQPQKVVFLGTPSVAAHALQLIFDAADKQGFVLVAIVTQPPARSSRGGPPTPSPVHAFALEKGLPVLCPESAKEEAFLAELESLKPDLCITAAYGQVLNERFLAIPRWGTLNIHPSLLPEFRGAAPVQRAVEAGVLQTGVSVAFTVRAMDSGPVVAQLRVNVDEKIKAPELLHQLFEAGAKLLLENLAGVFSGKTKGVAQIEDRATHAKKINPQEGQLRWSENAKVLHNKVRAFAGWPGTRAVFAWDGQTQEVKIITTQVGIEQAKLGRKVVLVRDVLQVECDDGSVLEIGELQPPGKKVLKARDFWNGLRTKNMTRGEG